MKIHRVISKHSPVLAVGIFLILLSSIAQVEAQSAPKILKLKGGVSVKISPFNDTRGVAAIVSVQGPGNCDIDDIWLTSWNMRKHHISDQICDTKIFGLRDISISGTASIEYYEEINASKSFRVRVKGGVTAVAKRVFGGGFDRTYLDSDDQYEDFRF